MNSEPPAPPPDLSASISKARDRGKSHKENREEATAAAEPSDEPKATKAPESDGEHEGSVSSVSGSEASSRGGRGEMRKASSHGVLNRSRQKRADQIFTAGAGEAVSGGSLDAAMLHEAVASLEGEEYAKALASLEGAREETFGLCRADFHVWCAESFAGLSEDRFAECADPNPNPNPDWRTASPSVRASSRRRCGS